MANKLTSLLRKVFLGSLAGIAASNSTTANTPTTFLEPNENENKFESILNRKPDLSPKLLLKKTTNDEWSFVSHRSHRSHSSHRSHYSSYSGGGGSNNSTPTNNSNNSGISPNYNSNSNSGTSNTGTTSTALQLGARTLKRGMSGTDVTELVNILLRKKYLKMDHGGSQVTGSYTFDETIEGAVKKFQSDNGLTSDGVCGSTTIYYLKNK
jgi:hypothetical protein